MDLVKELVLLKQEFERRTSEIASKDALESMEFGIICFHQLITIIKDLSLNDHYHQSNTPNVSKDEVHPFDGQVMAKIADFLKQKIIKTEKTANEYKKLNYHPYTQGCQFGRLHQLQDILKFIEDDSNFSE